MSLQHTTDQDFAKDVIKTEGLVLVDFWAEWCGPCRMISPILEDLHKEMGDKVKILKLNVDQNPAVPAQFNVRSIPTLVLFKSGQPISTKVGLMTKAKLVDWLKENA